MKRNRMCQVAAVGLVLWVTGCGDSEHVKVNEADPGRPVRPPADAPTSAPSVAEEVDSIAET